MEEPIEEEKYKKVYIHLLSSIGGGWGGEEEEEEEWREL
jgi:hypothetical protein